MVNTVNILNKADQDSLVLFDELGAGTDPVEGAALGISILNFLKNMGTRTMATTHYSELKLYALSTDGVQNASCEFDVETLRPTYRLLIGIPGKSNAFAISEKLGLPKFIIDDAKSRIDAEDEQFEDVLAELERQKKQIEKDHETISVYKSQIASLKKITNTELKRLMKRKIKFYLKQGKKPLIFLKKLRKLLIQQLKILTNTVSPAIQKNLRNQELPLVQKLKRIKATVRLRLLSLQNLTKLLTLNLEQGLRCLA